MSIPTLCLSPIGWGERIGLPSSSLLRFPIRCAQGFGSLQDRLSPIRSDTSDSYKSEMGRVKRC